MRMTGVALGSVAFVVCMSGCSPPVVEHDLSSGGPALGQPAILEYETIPPQIDLVEVDGRHVDVKRTTENRMPIRNLFKLAPGTHRVRFRGPEGYPLRPDVVEFEAGAGKRYRTGWEIVNNKETEGGVSTLYFNFVSLVVLEERDGRPVKVAAGALAPFKTGLDAEKNVLLYEETTLPKERTARVYFPRRGLVKSQSVFIAKMSGRVGETRVEYRRSSSDTWQLRLLPGEYEVILTMTTVGAPWKLSEVRSGGKLLTLKAEAGHTYRVNANIEVTDTKLNTDVIGKTQMQTSFRWDPVFEDVTGKGFVDE